MPRPFDILALQFSEVVHQYRDANDENHRKELLIRMGIVVREIEDLYKEHLKSLPLKLMEQKTNG